MDCFKVWMKNTLALFDNYYFGELIMPTPITFDQLISDSNDFRRDVLEFGENVGNKFMTLWDTLLDTDDGISEQAYDKLVELGWIIDPIFVANATKQVDATDGRFYTKKSYT